MLPTDVSLTLSLSYNCTGAELSLQSCDTDASVCNIFNNNQKDIVAVICEQVREKLLALPTAVTISLPLIYRLLLLWHLLKQPLAPRQSQNCLFLS